MTPFPGTAMARANVVAGRGLIPIPVLRGSLAEASVANRN
jgi:hypothetical protein